MNNTQRNELLREGGADDAPNDGILDYLPNPLELACVRAFYETGSMAEVSRQTMLSIYQLQKMAAQFWWEQELHAIRRCEQAALDARFTKILGTALDGIENRMEIGDTVVDKFGNEHRIPVEAATLVRVAELVFDKRQTVRELPVNYNAENGKLKELANKLEELGRAQAARTINAEMKEIANGSGD